MTRDPGSGPVAGERFEQAYQAGRPPWDIGAPQPAFEELVGTDVLQEPVLDVGCGTGEHVLLFAQAGLKAAGVDISPSAIQAAQEKAKARGLDARFWVGDGLALTEHAPGPWRTITDCGVFHVFSDADRRRYVESLGQVLTPGGRYVMLVFSEEEPTDWGGPRRISRAEIERAFGSGWRIERLEATIFKTLTHENEAGGGHAWLAVIQRT
ncbi:MAG: class I SAM-dependent methyltransferase [Candidatus Thermoplasmatota archaeon]|nr:class I SAM-dependent methyltransferase [Candidatus Thermoplasmatota archaeon]